MNRINGLTCRKGNGIIRHVECWDKWEEVIETGETLRMKARGAVREVLEKSAEAGTVPEFIYDLEHNIANAVFETLEISEFEQDEYEEVVSIQPRST